MNALSSVRGLALFGGCSFAGGLSHRPESERARARGDPAGAPLATSAAAPAVGSAATTFQSDGSYAAVAVKPARMEMAASSLPLDWQGVMAAVESHNSNNNVQQGSAPRRSWGRWAQPAQPAAAQQRGEVNYCDFYT